jgi:hypothetical protein
VVIKSGVSKGIKSDGENMQSWLKKGLALGVLGLSGLALASPQEVVIVRHAEKTTHHADPNLSQLGYQRAEALVSYIEQHPELKPDAIYVQKPGKKHHRTLRPLETCEPLAKQLNLTIVEWPVKKIADMVEKIKTKPTLNNKVVMICWSHNDIPEIAHDFGATAAPSSWSDKDFNSVWVIKFAGEQVSDFKVLQQSFGTTQDK